MIFSYFPCYFSLPLDVYGSVAVPLRGFACPLPVVHGGGPGQRRPCRHVHREAIRKDMKNQFLLMFVVSIPPENFKQVRLCIVDFADFAFSCSIFLAFSCFLSWRALRHATATHTNSTYLSIRVSLYILLHISTLLNAPILQCSYFSSIQSMQRWLDLLSTFNPASAVTALSPTPRKPSLAKFNRNILQHGHRVKNSEVVCHQALSIIWCFRRALQRIQIRLYNIKMIDRTSIAQTFSTPLPPRSISLLGLCKTCSGVPQKSLPPSTAPNLSGKDR